MMSGRSLLDEAKVTAMRIKIEQLRREAQMKREKTTVTTTE